MPRASKTWDPVSYHPKKELSKALEGRSCKVQEGYSFSFLYSVCLNGRCTGRGEFKPSVCTGRRSGPDQDSTC